MTKKIFSILILILLFCLFVLLKFSPDKSYKVLDVIEGDKFVLDLNRNGKADEDEIFHLKGVDAFPLRYNQKALSFAQEFDLSVDEALTLGYLGKKWAKKEFSDKSVTITSDLEEFSPNYNYRFAKLKFQNNDVGELLLKNGLGFAYKGGDYNPYIQFENRKKIKNTGQDGLGLDITALDKNKKLYHRLNCAQITYIKNIFLDFVPKKELQKDFWDFQPCKKCSDLSRFDKSNKSDKNIIKIIDKIEPPTPTAIFGEFDLFLINPNNYSRPSKRCRTSACQALLKNINEAKTSINFAIYGFEYQDDILNALNAAKNRGVEVKGVIDSRPEGTYPYSDSLKTQKALSLVADGLNGLMHNKFFIFDHKKVLTGTMNISQTGSGGYNSNTMIIINSTDVAKIYEDELSQMLEGKFQKFKEDGSVEKIVLPSGIGLSVYFSPKGDALKSAIVPLLRKASKEIYVSAFCITHKDIAQELIAAKARGVDVKVILDASSALNKGSKLNELRSSGVLTKVENWGGKGHEKNIEIDKKYFITGSMNFSNSGVSKNDENLLVIQSASMATFYSDYFLKKLWMSIDDKYLIKTPRAEGFESKNSCYDGIDNDHDGKIDSQDEGCKQKVK